MFEKTEYKKQFLLNKNILILLIIYFLCIVLCIPRDLNILGNDTYEILWMAYAIENGALFDAQNTWLINFFSFLGFYPFSHYPIGVPLLLSLFLTMKIPLELSYFYMTLISFTITFFGSYKFSSHFFKNKLYRYIFVIFFILTPIFLKINYQTVHPRAFFIGFMFWFLYYLFKAFEKPEIKNISFLIIFLVLMLLSHRLWVGTLVFVLLSIISKIFTKYQNKIKFSKKISLIIIFSLAIFYLAMFILGMNIFPIDPRKINSPWFSNNNFFGLFFNLILDLTTRLGVIIFFLPIGLYIQFNKIYSSLNKDDNQNTCPNDFEKSVYNVFLLGIISLSLIFTLYSTVLFLPFLVLYSAQGFEFIAKKLSIKKSILVGILFLLVSSIISFIYLETLSVEVFWLKIIIIIASIFSILLLFVALLIDNLKKTPNILLQLKQYFRKNISLLKFRYLTFLLPISIFSLSVLNGLNAYNSLEFPTDYITEEEKNVIEAINELGISGYIFASHFVVANHIGGYGFLPVIGGQNRPQQLYYDMVDPDFVREHTYFNIFDFIGDITFFDIVNEPSLELFVLVRNINVTIHEEFNNLEINHIQYCLAHKANGQVLNKTISSDEEYGSILIESSHNLIPVFETLHLVLWKYY